MHKPEMAQISTLEQVSPIPSPQVMGGVGVATVTGITYTPQKLGAPKITIADTMSPDHPDYCASCEG
jgi:hypothetical protein